MKKSLAAIFGAAMIVASTGVFSQPLNRFYGGAEFGQADFGADDDTAIKVFGGYQFAPQFGGELGYALLYDRGRTEVTALEAVLVGFAPLENRFSFFGKFGVASVEVDTRFRSDDKTELTYGVGLQYDAGERLGIRGGWQRYDTDEEIDLLSIGFVYRF